MLKLRILAVYSATIIQMNQGPLYLNKLNCTHLIEGYNCVKFKVNITNIICC